MSDPNPNLNINELKSALETSESYIHYDPSRVDYSVNEFELSQLEEHGNTIWKDIFYAAMGIGLPTLINGIVAQSKATKAEPWNTEMFLNYLVSGITLSIGILSCVVWMKQKRKKVDIISQIKNKPKLAIRR